MSVLARELEAYNRALQQYRRRAPQYDASRVTDDKGRIYITDGKHVFAIDPATGEGPATKLPDGLQLNQLGRTQLPEDPKYSLLRQNPIERKTEQVTAEYYTSPSDGLFNIEPSGYRVDGKPIDEKLYRLVKELPREQLPNPDYGKPGMWFVNQPEFVEGPQRAIFERDVSRYPSVPQLPGPAPDPTFAAVRRMQQPNLAQLEGGLIGDVLRSGGVK